MGRPIKAFVLYSLFLFNKWKVSCTYRRFIKNMLGKQSVEKHPLTGAEKREVKKYWGQLKYSDVRWHQYFKNEFGFDKKFVPTDLFYYLIEPVLNPRNYALLIQNKGLYNFFFPYFKQPESLIKNIDGLFYDQSMNLMSLDKAVKLLLEYDKRFVIKPTVDSARGDGVLLVKHRDKDLILDLLCKYRKNFIIQEVVSQSKEMSFFNSNSLNTIRVMTLFLNGKVSVLNSFIRFGLGNSCVDNLCAGGCAVNVCPDGTLRVYGIKSDSSHVFQTESGVFFKDIQLSFYADLVEKVCEMHRRMPLCALISWDIAVNSKGEYVMIEVNLTAQPSYYNQFMSGFPLFKERTDEVIQYVKNHGVGNVVLKSN